MIPRFQNALTGRLEELRAEAPPALRLSREAPQDDRLASFRLRCVGSCLDAALRHLGYAPEESRAGSCELHCGTAAPARGARVWLKVAAPGGEISGMALELLGLGAGALRLHCLKARYRDPLDLSEAALERSREDFLFLRERARALAASSLAPNPHGVAGYKKRLRDALADDLDLPGAVQSLLDALRPGALSPGSQLAALREADAVLGLGLF